MFGLFENKCRIEDLKFDSTFDQIKKRIRILVVDDDKSHFPIKAFKDNNYNIDYWSKITSENMHRIVDGDYDILILDMHGVASKDVSSNGGVGLLKYFKQSNPAIYILVFSNYEFSINDCKEIQQYSDDMLQKPVEYVTCSPVVDSIIKDKFNAKRFSDILIDYLQSTGMTNKDIVNTENDICKNIKKGQSHEIIRTNIKSKLLKPETITAVMNIVTAFINYYSAGLK